MNAEKDFLGGRLDDGAPVVKQSAQLEPNVVVPVQPMRMRTPPPPPGPPGQQPADASAGIVHGLMALPVVDMVGVNPAVVAIASASALAGAKGSEALVGGIKEGSTLDADAIKAALKVTAYSVCLLAACGRRGRDIPCASFPPRLTRRRRAIQP